MFITCKDRNGDLYDINPDNVTFATPDFAKKSYVVYFVGGGSVSVTLDSWDAVKSIMGSRARAEKRKA